jgi:hypothetical protein
MGIDTTNRRGSLQHAKITCNNQGPGQISECS